MAVMLRLQGVPARVVTGFATGEWEGSANRYRVPISAAHAWVEVHFPGIGWVEFEPTPSRSAFIYPEHDRLTQKYGSAQSPGRARPNISWRWAAGGVLLPIALGALVLAMRRRARMAGADMSDRVADLYWRMRRLIDRGAERKWACLTPQEFLQANESMLGSKPRLAKATRALTSIYIQAMYAPRPPSEAEVAMARHAWRLAWRERIRLTWGLPHAPG